MLESLFATTLNNGAGSNGAIKSRSWCSNRIDRWDGHTYQRVLAIGKKPIEVSVAQTSPPDAPWLRAILTGKQISVAERALVKKALERLLGIKLELSEFYLLATRDARLGPLVERFSRSQAAEIAQSL